MRLYSIYQAYSLHSAQKPPVFCNDDFAWMGKGFYFWDSIINDAHWWGEKHYNGQYAIFASKYDHDSPSMFDLLGDAKHREQFCEWAGEFCSKISDTKSIKVRHIIEFLKKFVPDFYNNYKAIRARPIPEKSNLYFYDEKNKFCFFTGNKIQICVLDLSFLEESGQTVFKSIFDSNSMI